MSPNLTNAGTLPTLTSQSNPIGWQPEHKVPDPRSVANPPVPPVRCYIIGAFSLEDTYPQFLRNGAAKILWDTKAPVRIHFVPS